MIAKESVPELSAAEFSELINQKELNVIKFYAEWCMPCVMMGPIFEAVAEKQSKAKFGKVNIDESEKLAKEYDVETIPCTIFFKKGKEIDRITGSCSEDELQDKIKRNI